MKALSQLAGFLAIAVVLTAQTLWAAPQANAPIMPFKDIEKGMKGVGWTTFSGVEPEPFDAEIVGFSYNAMGPGQHIIVALLHSEKIDFTSTIAGMSGSPVYIGDKLIGAVSLALSKFPKEPLVGITPIESMIKAGNVYGGELAVNKDQLEKKLSEIGASFIPLQQVTPTINNRKGALADSKKRVENLTQLIPGGPIFTFYSVGDIEVCAVGTITDIRDNIVYAFGHTFNGSGHTNVPFASGEIVHVVANQELSFKMGNAGPVLGTLYEDRCPAIVGRIGDKPDLLPVKVHFATPDRTEDYDFSIIKDTYLTANIVSKALTTLLTENIDYNKAGALKVQSRVKVKNHGSLNFTHLASMKKDLSIFGIVFTSYSKAVAAATGDYDNLLDLPTTALEVESLEYTISYDPHDISVSIINLEIDKYRVKPGESLKARIKFRDNYGQIIEKQLAIQLPKDIPVGNVKLKIGTPPALPPMNFTSYTTADNFYRYLENMWPDGYLYWQLEGQGAALDNGNRRYHNLPGNYAALAAGDHQSNRTGDTIFTSGKEEFNYSITNKAEAAIVVY